MTALATPDLKATMTTQLTPAALVVTLSNDSAGLPARDVPVTTAPQLLYTDGTGAALFAAASPVTVTVHYDAVPAPSLPAGVVALLLPTGAVPDLTRPKPPGAVYAGLAAPRVRVTLPYAGLQAGQSERYEIPLAGTFATQAAPLAWTLTGGRWQPVPATQKGGTTP